jgi:hypothetical protein
MSHNIIALMAIYVAGTNKSRLDLHSVCPIILADFNHVWRCSADCRKSALHQIVRESSSGSRVVRRGQADMSNPVKALFVCTRTRLISDRQFDIQRTVHRDIFF